MTAQPMAYPPAEPRHALRREYQQFLGQHYPNPDTRRQLELCSRQFVRAYPDLQTWFGAPLMERVGRYYRAGSYELINHASYAGRQYLYFLASRGYATFDWDWLIALPKIHLRTFVEEANLAAGVEQLSAEAIQLGYSSNSAGRWIDWILYRLFLHDGFQPVAQIREGSCAELARAVQQFGQRPDIALFFGSAQRYHKTQAMVHAGLHKLHVVLYHRGQVSTEPRVVLPAYAQRITLRPRMEAVTNRYLAARRVTDRPGTVALLDVTLRDFIAWLVRTYPELESFAPVTREHLLEYADQLNQQICARTGRPFAFLTKRRRLAHLGQFFRDLAEWGWEETPGRPLLSSGDLPRIPQRVPRYIPAEELDRLMTAVRALSCPYQRAALLIARWSGARRGEIGRLPVDCLDAYPDGSARLRLPAGKTYRERIIPLHEEAAQAIRELQALRHGERGLVDPQTGVVTRYLFMHFGKRYSATYLFTAALRTACEAAGLVDAQGKPTITAHRLRHTVGTQLAEKGAKLHTIMKILGHSSPTMSLVYAQISDQAVLRDYQAVLGPGVALAGPFAETLRAGQLSAADVDWLQSNFFKTELELGHCLRLPQEGPCECELYLTCAKFVTTRAYAPRLRQRRQVELTLIEDAARRGWLREVERHHCTVQRIEQYLQDLGEPLEGAEARDGVAIPVRGSSTPHIDGYEGQPEPKMST